MNKYTWSGGINGNVLLEVVACRGSMTEQPNDLVINRQAYGVDGQAYGVDVDASERFMVVLKIEGKRIASLHAHEVVKRAWDN